MEHSIGRLELNNAICNAWGRLEDRNGHMLGRYSISDLQAIVLDEEVLKASCCIRGPGLRVIGASIKLEAFTPYNRRCPFAKMPILAERLRSKALASINQLQSSKVAIEDDGNACPNCGASIG